MDLTLFIVYFVCKFAAYSFWCGLGAKLHGHQDGLVWRGLGFGIVRLLMGAIFGLFAIVALLNALSVVTRDSWQL